MSIGRRYLALVCCGVLLVSAGYGCSVGMAMSGKKAPDMNYVHVGATRGEVELQLGAPVESTTLDNGMKQDTYEYEAGKEPSVGRAAVHAAMDVFTLGLWEAAGTPIEAMRGDKQRVIVVYDSNDKVASIKVAHTTSSQASSSN